MPATDLTYRVPTDVARAFLDDFVDRSTPSARMSGAHRRGPLAPRPPHPWACNGLPASAMNASPRASFWVGCACVSNANPSGWRPLLKTSPLLAVSHRGDLWFAVGHARDGCLVDGFGAPTGNLLSDEDPLLEPLVRQLHPGNNVPDRVNVRHIGAQALIRDDEAAVHGDPLLLVAEPACGRPPPDRDQEYIGLERVAPRNRHAHAVLGPLDTLERSAETEPDPPLAKGLLQRARRVDVLAGQQVRKRLQGRHVCTKGPVDAGELTPMTPPPRTSTDRGTRSSASAWSEVMTR